VVLYLMKHHARKYRVVEVQLPTLLISPPDSNDQFHILATLYQGKEPLLPMADLCPRLITMLLQTEMSASIKNQIPSSR